MFADGIQFNCYQVKLSSIGSSQLDTGEYADLVGAEGREKREPPSRDDGGKKKKKLIRQRTTGLGNVFVLISSERIRLLHGQVHGLSPARLNRRASAVRQNRKGCEQGHVTGWNSLTTAWALYGDAGHGPSTGEPFFLLYKGRKKERASFRIRLFHFPF